MKRPKPYPFRESRAHLCAPLDFSSHRYPPRSTAALWNRALRKLFDKVKLSPDSEASIGNMPCV